MLTFSKDHLPYQYQLLLVNPTLGQKQHISLHQQQILHDRWITFQQEQRCPCMFQIKKWEGKIQSFKFFLSCSYPQCINNQSSLQRNMTNKYMKNMLSITHHQGNINRAQCHRITYLNMVNFVIYILLSGKILMSHLSRMELTQIPMEAYDSFWNL